MTVSTAVRSPRRLRAGALAALAAAVAVAGGVTALVSSDGAGNGADARSGAPSRAAVLSALTPESRQYVDWVSSATPEQLVVVFGTDGVQPTRTLSKPHTR